MNKLNLMMVRARAAFRRDAAENSIMQTISIAVSAILIAAGLVVAPSLINNAKDTNAKSDLSNVSYGEEFANSNGGAYVAVNSAATYQSFVTANGNAQSGQVKTTVSSKEYIGVWTDTLRVGYIALIQSSSGNWFIRTGAGTSTLLVDKQVAGTVPVTADITAALTSMGLTAGTDYTAVTTPTIYQVP